MKRQALLVVIVGLLIAADKDDAAREDLKKMTGNWTMVRGEQDGKQLSTKTVKAARLRIKGEEHTVKLGNDTMKGTHKLDPTKKPKTIDVQDTEGPFKDQTLLGIYRILDDDFSLLRCPRQGAAQSIHHEIGYRTSLPRVETAEEIELALQRTQAGPGGCPALFVSRMVAGRWQGHLTGAAWRPGMQAERYAAHISSESEAAASIFPCGTNDSTLLSNELSPFHFTHRVEPCLIRRPLP
jgi:uncharacterized protein (TIGR03067 family)